MKIYPQTLRALAAAGAVGTSLIVNRPTATPTLSAEEQAARAARKEMEAYEPTLFESAWESFGRKRYWLGVKLGSFPPPPPPGSCGICGMG